MKCEECASLLSEYIDGRLSAEKTAEVSAHLARCAECRALEAELKSTVAILGGLERKSAPFDLAERVVSRLERQMLLSRAGAGRVPSRTAPKPRVITPWRFAGVGAAAAALFLAALYLYVAPGWFGRGPKAVPEGATTRFGVSESTAGAAKPADEKVRADLAARKEPNPALGEPQAAPATAAGAPEARAFKYEHAAADKEKASAPAATAAPQQPKRATNVYADALDRARGIAHGGTTGSSALKDETAGEPSGAPEGRRSGAGAGKGGESERQSQLKGLGYLGLSEEAKKTRAAGKVAEAPVPAKTQPESKPSSGGAATLMLGTEAPPAATEAAEKASEVRLGRGAAEVPAQAGVPAETKPAAGRTPSEDKAEVERIGATDDVVKAEPVETQYYFNGKISKSVNELLKLLPGDQKTLPGDDASLEELKTAAAERNVRVVELSPDKGVLVFRAEAAEARKINEQLLANAALVPVRDAGRDKLMVADYVEIRRRAREADALYGYPPQTASAAKQLQLNMVTFTRQPTASAADLGGAEKPPEKPSE